jgi:hypothetical protein
VAHLVSSTALTFLTSVSEKRKPTTPSAIQVKNRQETICIEEKLDVISRLGKGERIVDIWHDVTVAHSSICTVCDNADRITMLSQDLKFDVFLTVHHSIDLFQLPT